MKHIKIDPKIHQRAKIAATRLGMSLKDYAEAALTEKMSRKPASEAEGQS